MRAVERASVRFRGDLLSSLATFWAFVLVTVIGNRSVIFHPVYEWGDTAANAILIERARGLRLLVGNYSRFKFNHPGPAFLYVQALGERVLQIIPGVSTPMNADLLAAIVLNAAFFTAVVRILRRSEGTAAALLFAVALTFQVRFVHGMLASTWMPHLYFLPFALFVASLAMVVAGRNHFVALSISTAFLVHGHVSFALIAGLPFALMLVVRRRLVIEWLHDRRTRIASLVTLVLFALPLVLGTFVNGISFWTAYLSQHSNVQNTPRTLADSARFTFRFWRFGIDPSMLGIIVTAALFTAGLTRLRLRTPQGHPAWLVAFSLAGGLSLLYVHIGVDDLQFDYTGIFIGALAAVATGLTVLGTFRGLQPTGVGLRVSERIRTSLPAGALTVCCMVALAALAYRPGINPDRGARWIPEATNAVKGGTDANGTLRLQFAPQAWPDAVGLLVSLRRADRRACVEDASWAFMVTKRHICGDRPGPLVHLGPGEAPGDETLLYTTPNGNHVSAAQPAG